MAASVTLVGEAFADARYELLGAFGGFSKYEALGRMAWLWRYCTQHSTYIVPAEVVAIYFAEPNWVVRAGLAEETNKGFRIRGTRGRIEWLAQRRKSAKKGGASTRAKWQATREAIRRAAGPPLAPQNGGPNEGPSVSVSVSAKEREREAEEASPPQPDFETAEGTRPGTQPDPSPKASPRKRRQPAHPIPPDWVPSGDHAALAREQGVDLAREAAKFRDHHTAKASQFVQWGAAFSNWLRRAAEYRGNGRDHTATPATGDDEDQVLA